jgi:hypothetical protein
MKIAIHDKCSEVFKKLKFEKKHRYVIYKIEGENKIEGERIVSMEILRWSNQPEIVNRHGPNSSTNCPRSNIGSLSSISNSKPMTESTQLKFSSATGRQMAQKSKIKCFTRLEKRPSRHILTSILNKSTFLQSMRYDFILHS